MKSQDRHEEQHVLRIDKAVAKLGFVNQRFVRMRDVEQVILDALGREIVTDRDLMFCDHCGDCSRSVVSFDDGVLCRLCAKSAG